MAGKYDITDILRNLDPVLNEGSFVFITLKNTEAIPENKIIGQFKEKEGNTLILKQEDADSFNLTYDFIASWITLNVHSSLYAVGLIAAVSKVLAQNNIACNCMAGYYHDHLFVAKKDARSAIRALRSLEK